MEGSKLQQISGLLKTIDRYNIEHLIIFEDYVEEQARDNTYHLEANLNVLKFYQFYPSKVNMNITVKILLKALTNLPHSDFTLCKCLLSPVQTEHPTIAALIYLADILEQCDFDCVWYKIESIPEVSSITGFYESIRKFICHLINSTYQKIEKSYLLTLLGNIDDHTLALYMKKYGWKDQGKFVFIASQEANIKSKNITEKVEFDFVAPLMANCL